MKRLLRLKDVILATGLPRSTIYAEMASGKFPLPVKIGAKSVARPDDVVSQWVEDRIRESAAQPKRGRSRPRKTVEVTA